MNLLDFLSHRLGQLATIAAALALLIPRVRSAVLSFFRGIVLFGRAPWIIAEIQRDIAFVKSQVVNNGGSTMRDAVTRVEWSVNRLQSFRRHDFWVKARPAMEMDGDGRVMLVSEAACHLFGVSNPDDLCRRSWLQYIDRESVGEFLDGLLDAARNESAFRMEVGLVASDRVDLGQWEFRALPIVGDAPGTKSFTGLWVPVDERAMEIHAKYGWAR